MAMNDATLAAEMEANVRAALGLGATPYPQLTAYVGALAAAIVNHITTNGSVSTGTINTQPDGSGSEDRYIIGGGVIS